MCIISVYGVAKRVKVVNVLSKGKSELFALTYRKMKRNVEISWSEVSGMYAICKRMKGLGNVFHFW